MNWLCTKFNIGTGSGGNRYHALARKRLAKLVVFKGAQRAKRGPKSQLERQLEAVATLPRNQHPEILAAGEALIAHHAGR